jgi:hypothetical protein
MLKEEEEQNHLCTCPAIIHTTESLAVPELFFPMAITLSHACRQQLTCHGREQHCMNIAKQFVAMAESLSERLTASRSKGGCSVSLMGSATLMLLPFSPRDCGASPAKYISWCGNLNRGRNRD